MSASTRQVGWCIRLRATELQSQGHHVAQGEGLPPGKAGDFQRLRPGHCCFDEVVGTSDRTRPNRCALGLWHWRNAVKPSWLTPGRKIQMQLWAGRQCDGGQIHPCVYWADLVDIIQFDGFTDGPGERDARCQL